MQIGSVTTPFGRRSMTLGMLMTQVNARDIEPNKSIDKWKAYRALCEARVRLGVTDRALAIMNALLSFYPKAEISEDNGLVVFPSNAQLSLRANGMAEATIRRHLAVLVEAGLLARKDSANGKRYARRDGAGSVDEAFGFSLGPLLTRYEEIEALAAEVIAERLHLQRLRERLTICRRDVAKLIATAMEEGMVGDWERAHIEFRRIVTAFPRSPNGAQVAETLDEMEMLKDEIVNRLEMLANVNNPIGNPLQNERHIQNSKSESPTESEPLSKEELGDGSGSTVNVVKLELKSFPLGMVLQACPEIVMYGQGGAIGSWRELMAAAIVVRSMLGVSPSAYQEACEVLGPENAATVMACILEKAGHINSAGGYLRTLTDRARRGEFSLGPMLMALLRTSGTSLGRTG